MDVSIIIVNYNTEQLISDCINSIYEKTKNVIFEVIVVDNASKNDTSIIKHDKRITYIESPKNLGFGGANNLGVQYAKGKYLFFLNPDTLLINNAIYILYSYLQNNPNVGICGGNLYDINKSPAHSYRIIAPGILSEIYTLVSGVPFKYFLHEDFNPTSSPIRVAYVTGADLLIRASIFNKIGGFNKQFFMYFEETYLCKEVSKLKYKIYNVPQAKIIHYEGKSFEWKQQREEMYFKSRKKYIISQCGKLSYYVCNFVYAITCSTRIISFTLIYNDRKRRYWIHKLKQLLQ